MRHYSDRPGYKKVYIPNNPPQTGCKVKTCPRCMKQQEYTATTILCDQCINEPEGYIEELRTHAVHRDIVMDYYERGCDGEV